MGGGPLFTIISAATLSWLTCFYSPFIILVAFGWAAGHSASFLSLPHSDRQRANNLRRSHRRPWTGGGFILIVILAAAILERKGQYAHLHHLPRLGGAKGVIPIVIAVVANQRGMDRLFLFRRPRMGGALLLIIILTAVFGEAVYLRSFSISLLSLKRRRIQPHLHLRRRPQMSGSFTLMFLFVAALERVAIMLPSPLRRPGAATCGCSFTSPPPMVGRQKRVIFHIYSHHRRRAACRSGTSSSSSLPAGGVYHDTFVIPSPNGRRTHSVQSPFRSLSN